MPARAAATSPRRRARGFSLFELVAVLLLVGVLAVVAVPQFMATTSLTLPSVKAQLAASIRHAQGLAMSRGQRYRINFTAGSYQITDMGGTPIVQPVTASTAPIAVAPASLSGFNPPLTGNYLAFDTRGTPYVSATAPLAATATITITAGTDSATVAIAPETGHVQ